MNEFQKIICVLSVGSASLSFGADKAPMVDLRLAAEKGDAQAQYQLANQYNGSLYYDTAEEWYRKAAAQGVVDAWYALGKMYVEGRIKFHPKNKSVPKNLEAGIEWLTRAANVGHHESQRELGNCYAKGTGVTKDPVEAYKWIKMGCNGGRTWQALYLDSLVLKLTPDQIAEGEKRIQEFESGKRADPLAGRIHLGGIMRRANNATAIINGKFFHQGESGNVLIGTNSLTLRCQEIKESSVIVDLGEGRQVELKVTK